MTEPCHVVGGLVAAIFVRNASPRAKVVVGAGLVMAHLLEDCLPHWHYFRSVRSPRIDSYSLLSIVSELVVVAVMLLVVRRTTGVQMPLLVGFTVCSMLPDLLHPLHLGFFDYWNRWAEVREAAVPASTSIGFEVLWNLIGAVVLTLAVVWARRHR